MSLIAATTCSNAPAKVRACLRARPKPACSHACMLPCLHAPMPACSYACMYVRIPSFHTWPGRHAIGWPRPYCPPNQQLSTRRWMCAHNIACMHRATAYHGGQTFAAAGSRRLLRPDGGCAAACIMLLGMFVDVWL